jgi:hypothetical protein
VADRVGYSPEPLWPPIPFSITLPRTLWILDGYWRFLSALLIQWFQYFQRFGANFCPLAETEDTKSQSELKNRNCNHFPDDFRDPFHGNGVYQDCFSEAWHDSPQSPMARHLVMVL